MAEGQGADVDLSVGNLVIDASGTLNANSYNIKIGGNYSTLEHSVQAQGLFYLKQVMLVIL